MNTTATCAVSVAPTPSGATGWSARWNAPLPEGRIEGAAAGVHLVLALPVALDPLRLRRAAAAHGVVVEDIGERLRGPAGPAPPAGTRLVLGYGRVPTAGVEAAVAGLAAALRAAGL